MKHLLPQMLEISGENLTRIQKLNRNRQSLPGVPPRDPNLHVHLFTMSEVMTLPSSYLSCLLYFRRACKVVNVNAIACLGFGFAFCLALVVMWREESLLI